MGSVYLGERKEGWEQVAVKVIHPEYARSPDRVARFFAEARAAARVRHAHVVRLEEFGQDPDGEFFIIMELLDGEELRTLLVREGMLPVDRAVAIAVQLA